MASTTRTPPVGPRYRHLEVRLDSAIDRVSLQKTYRVSSPGSLRWNDPKNERVFDLLMAGRAGSGLQEGLAKGLKPLQWTRGDAPRGPDNRPVDPHFIHLA